MKGQFNFYIVGILLAIFSLIVVIGVYNQISNSADVSDVNEKLCTSRISALSTEVGEEGITEDLINVLGVNPVDFMKVCPTQVITIDPDNLNCDQEVININPYDSTKNCVIDEILDLSKRCWEMNLEGSIDGYNWACYTSSIGKISKQDPNDIIRSRLRSHFDCDSEIANSNCRILEKDSFVNAQISSVYNTIISTNKYANINLIKDCSNINSNYDGEVLVTINPSGKIYDSELYEKLYEEIYSTNNYNLIDDIINTSKKDCNLNDLKSEIKENINSYRDLDSKMDYQNNIIHQNYCLSIIEDCPEEKRFDLELTISRNFEEKIYFDDIKKVADTKKYNNYLTFSEFFRLSDDEMENELVLLNDQPILPSSAFQISYCDGLSPISAGLVPMYMCGNKKHISISNELNNAGSRFGKENIEGSCPIFNSISSIDKVTFDSALSTALDSICSASLI